MNKKRPIYSKQGNRIISNTLTASHNSNMSSVSNLNPQKKKRKNEEDLSKELEAELVKKREYLHKTLSNLMP